MSKIDAIGENTILTTRNAVLLTFLSLAVSALTGCHEIVIAPADPVGGGGAVLVSAQPSYITLPVTAKLSDVSALVNQQVPKRVEGRYDSPITKPVPHFHGLLHKPTFTRESIFHIDYNAERGDIKFAASGDKISVNTSFSGGGRAVPPDLKGDVSGSVAGSSTLTVAPDYSLKPVIDLTVNIDRARAELLRGISLKGLVQDKVNDAINKYKGQIGPALGQMVDLRKHALEAWNKLPASVAVPGTKDLWISFDPEAFSLDGLHANADTVTAVLSLKAQVKAFLQAEPPMAPPRAPLPNISAPPADNKFHLSVPIEVVPQELNRELALLIRDRVISTVEFEKGSEVVVIKAVTVLPSGNQLYLRVGFAGVKGKWAKNVRGTLIFEVHPVLSADKQTLGFDRIDYTAETASTLKGLGLEVLLNAGRPIIVSILQKKIVVNISRPLQGAKSKASAAVAKLTLPPPITLKLSVDNLVPEELLTYGNKIYMGFAATGVASVTY